VFDSSRVLDVRSVSQLPTGRLDDGLAPDYEQIAEIEHDGATDPVCLVRRQDARGTYWAFSADTSARIDAWYAELPDRWIRDRLSRGRLEKLLLRGPFGLLRWQWLALPFAALLAWLLGHVFRLISTPVMRRIGRLTRNRWLEALIDSAGPPAVLACAALSLIVICLLIRIPRDAFAFIGTLSRSVLAFAVFWAIWRASRVLLDWSLSSAWAAHSASGRNLLTIGSNLLRAMIVALGCLAIVAAVGYPIGTVLAGLGIGGLALAFGAQKTIENVFGSIALAIDQPFRIGDFVKVEDFVGTVESIGVRSTRIRTLDRTIISMPNGKVADQRVESFETRDRMRLATTLSLTYGTTRRQMEQVLAGLDHVLRSHPRIWPDGITVAFKDLASSALDIEVMAWFKVPNWGDFQQCRQEVLLDFLRVVEAAGTSLAFPTRTVHLVRERGPVDGDAGTGTLPPNHGA
jgi:MscS family membrane protein